MLLLSDEKFSGLSNSLRDIQNGLRQQALVVRALILREVRTRFGENRLGYIWALLEPCLFIAVWLVVFSIFRVGASIRDMNPLIFMATGIIPFFAFRNVATFVESGVSANNALLQFSLVKSVDTLLARFILESGTQISVAFLVFGTMIFLGKAPAPHDLLGVLVAGACLLILAFGYGAFNCMIISLWPLYTKFTPVISRILFWTSGIFFLAEKFPPAVRNLLAWNPVLHGLELFRSAWSYTYQTPIGSFRYILGCAGGFLLIALLFERMARQELQTR